MCTRLILIRHGETDWSVQKRYCGFKDIGLNSAGIEQAEKVYGRLRDEKVDRIYSSDLRRALDFAGIIFKGMIVEKMPELREINFGVFEGLAYEDVMKRHPGIYGNWLKNPYEVNIPKGEIFSDFKRRVESALDKIISVSKGKLAAVVTHAGPIRIIAGNILKPKSVWDIKPDLASISIIEFRNDKGKVALFNDRSHLNG